MRMSFDILCWINIYLFIFSLDMQPCEWYETIALQKKEGSISFKNKEVS